MSVVFAVGEHSPTAPLIAYRDARRSAIRIERRTLVAELRSGGRLVPWIGPAIRGITALRYRASVCQQPRETWANRWKNCRGCEHLPTCGYGVAFEPESVAVHVDAVRRVVIAPEFPVASDARRGQLIPIHITSIGAEASATVPGIIEALADAGRGDGLGPDRVRFAIVEPRPAVESIVVDPRHLPEFSNASPAVDRLTIRLQSPLFLRERESRTRRMVLNPDFATFVKHSARIIREFFPDTVGDPELAVAADVTTVVSDLAPFRQEKSSRRTFRRFELEGVVGSITFAKVPGCFLPWLMLAGILHAGGHRVAGAGGWTVHTEPLAGKRAPGKPR